MWLSSVSLLDYKLHQTRFFSVHFYNFMEIYKYCHNKHICTKQVFISIPSKRKIWSSMKIIQIENYEFEWNVGLLNFSNFNSRGSFHYTTMMHINHMECFFLNLTYNIVSENCVQFLIWLSMSIENNSCGSHSNAFKDMPFAASTFERNILCCKMKSLRSS